MGEPESSRSGRNQSDVLSWTHARPLLGNGNLHNQSQPQSKARSTESGQVKGSVSSGLQPASLRSAGGQSLDAHKTESMGNGSTSSDTTSSSQGSSSTTTCDLCSVSRLPRFVKRGQRCQQYPASTPQQTFTLLELFVSGACQPSAQLERCLLSQLKCRATHSAAQVYPIAYHVDYWNDLGWKDPFSVGIATRRQQWYRSRLQNASPLLFTPQVVVNGSEQVLGKNLEPLLSGQASRAALAAPHQFVVDLQLTANSGNSVVVEPIVTCEQDTLHQVDPSRLALVVLVVDEGACEVEVARGCNKGTSVQHVNIAADWRQLKLKNFNGECRGVQVPLSVPLGGIWSDFKALVAFVQDKRDGRVLGFCRKELPPCCVCSFD